MAKNEFKKDLKLINWVDSGCPSIDLNNNLNEVVRLVEEIKMLRELKAPLLNMNAITFGHVDTNGDVILPSSEFRNVIEERQNRYQFNHSSEEDIERCLTNWPEPLVESNPDEDIRWVGYLMIIIVIFFVAFFLYRAITNCK